jgi:D-amino peptidase
VWEIAAAPVGVPRAALSTSRAADDPEDSEDSEQEAELSVLELPAISLPATLEVHVQTADMAEVASWVRGVERTGVRTVSIRGDDPLAIYRSFVAMTYITRVAEGR